MNPLVTAIAAAFAFAGLEMTATWFAAVRLRNFGIVDAVWSAGFSVIALIGLAVAAPGLSPGARLRPAMLAALVVIWSLRLAGHLAVRIRAHHPAEDVRYAELRKKWGKASGVRMLGFYLVQGVLQAVLSAPILIGILNTAPPGAMFGLGPWELAGAVLWGTGVAGESLADAQLARFKADPARRGGVCEDGLWRHSRHPNYFFEWLVWVGYGVWACGAPLGWIGLSAPALMLHFLVNVTGIPMTEALSLRSRGEAYRRYQRTTSPFVPWFKRGA